ncbi:MAG: 2,4-dihydroxyhept-2-ene-1,7-dioic acid aldolase [Chloroflexi bacterium]|nr:2,4-dihydroxyhept-2-ene-1,7-dioic acid aldolase [Chloroflexota bacterium]MYD16751.1 2,4-dihydroxyhept-2-ene-1,7-dioic acid aldolase [Chloroflexota bacterium]
MAVLPNTLRDLLNAGKPTIGTHFLFNDPDIAELIGDTGEFDYAEYVAEYSTFDMKTLYHLARAAQCGNLPLMIKLDQANQTFWAQAALGAGFKAVLYTDIRTPEDVDLAMQAIRPDKPKTLGIGGHMGVKTRRPALAGYADSYGDDLYDIVTVVMLEKRVALDDIDAILERSAELGVDMTQWGPSDYGFSFDERPDADEIRAAEEQVIAKSLEYGVHPRIEIGAVEQAQRYLDLGVKHFCIGWDRFLLNQGYTDLGRGLRELMDA